MSVETVKKDGPGSTELPRSSSPVVKANALLFAQFERSDLKRAEDYLRDFGLLPVARTEKQLFMRGTGPHPYIYRVTLGPTARFLGLGHATIVSAADGKADHVRPIEPSPV
jgi:hypothetical protein